MDDCYQEKKITPTCSWLCQPHMIVRIYTYLMLLVWITLQMLINVLSIQNSKSNNNEAKRLLPNHPNFYTTRKEGIACFSNLLSELQHDVVLFKEYVDKIEKQLVEEVVKKAHGSYDMEKVLRFIQASSNTISQSNQAYIVYDNSAKPTKTSPSISKCLEVGSCSTLAKSFLECT